MPVTLAGRESSKARSLFPVLDALWTDSMFIFMFLPIISSRSVVYNRYPG
jgi:hypothetical protein